MFALERICAANSDVLVLRGRASKKLRDTDRHNTSNGRVVASIVTALSLGWRVYTLVCDQKALFTVSQRMSMAVGPLSKKLHACRLHVNMHLAHAFDPIKDCLIRPELRHTGSGYYRPSHMKLVKIFL